MIAPLLVASLLVCQSEPYKVFETKPVITDGPYLVALSDTSVSVVWITDTPSHSVVRFGSRAAPAALTAVSTPQVAGLVPV